MAEDAEDWERLTNLIDLIYQGATEPALWPHTILPALAHGLGADKAVLFTPFVMPQAGGLAFFHGISPAQIELYATRYQAEDIHAQMAVAKGLVFEGSVMTSEDLLPHEQLAASRYYQEYLCREDMVHLMNTVVFGPDSSSGLPVVVCTFWRGRCRQPFGERERARLRMLSRHVSRAVGVMQRLRQTELRVETSRVMLDRLSSGVLLLDAFANVTFANSAAKRMLAEQDGLRLRHLSHSPGFGTLVADRADDALALQAAVEATLSRDPYATPHFSQLLTVQRLSGTGVFTLNFSSLTPRQVRGLSAEAAIIFLNDSQQPCRVDDTLLRQAYGLTPAEGRVANELLKVATTREVAQALGCSVNTVRTQVKQVYAKLGVASRAEFVRFMMTLSS